MDRMLLGRKLLWGKRPKNEFCWIMRQLLLLLRLLGLWVHLAAGPPLSPASLPSLHAAGGGTGRADETAEGGREGKEWRGE